MNFGDFQQNNSVFMQKNRTFEKYHLPRKFVFCQLMKNFVDFLRNNNVSMEGKKKEKKYSFENISHLKISCFDNSSQIFQIFG